ncbi:MAG: hypothetical protein ACLQLC_14635 [Candidatus Sulfotelmatobacter sp.]
MVLYTVHVNESVAICANSPAVVVTTTLAMHLHSFGSPALNYRGWLTEEGGDSLPAFQGF